ncbi:adenylate/guanylate cyclase domain-containing protein [Candidatus Bathyarchaeota archaeon]|nr:adenylate/guanylate cyclase domain-containing protein [Candidatus Bathyarchaeota archaeon]
MSLLLLLNDFHGQMSDAVEAHGGQVLKFMGDGMLAVFEGDDEGCKHALIAADDAACRMATINEGRLEVGEPAIRYGLALHWGDVMYGNIGSARRLDFTVIGPAVNLAARLEGLCSRLGTDLIISAPFAERCGEPVQSLGSHQLKGIDEPVEAFGRRVAKG